jgi:hypothetical protein
MLDNDDDNNNDNDKKQWRRPRLSVSEAQEWLFRLANDPNQFEKERFIDAINEYNRLIEEYLKLYDKAPTTDRFTRARIVSGIAQSKRELAKTQAKYEVFRRYKVRTAISK